MEEAKCTVCETTKIKPDEIFLSIVRNVCQFWRLF